MDNLYKLFDLWYIKIIFGFFLTIVSPIETSIIIIFIIILLDTFTGTISAIKLKRFNSRIFRKAFKKTLTYFSCIFISRLVEIGALGYFDTFLLTQIIASFLILTEAISIIENLTLLGLPISKNFISILFKQIRIGIFDGTLITAQISDREISDIDEIINYQVPLIQSDQLRRILNVYCEEWREIAKNIISLFEKSDGIDNELLYYKVISIIKIGLEEIKQGIDMDVYKGCQSFHQIHNDKTALLLLDIKQICFNLDSTAKKKEELLKALTIFLYKMVIQAQKENNGFCIK